MSCSMGRDRAWKKFYAIPLHLISFTALMVCLGLTKKIGTFDFIQ